MKADDFKVIDNKMGNVRITSDLRFTGELRAPRVDGDLGITTGQINLDPILAQFVDSAYSTEQTEYVTGAAAAKARRRRRPPSPFDALADVRAPDACRTIW